MGRHGTHTHVRRILTSKACLTPDENHGTHFCRSFHVKYNINSLDTKNSTVLHYRQDKFPAAICAENAEPNVSSQFSLLFSHRQFHGRPPTIRQLDTDVINFLGLCGTTTKN